LIYPGYLWFQAMGEYGMRRSLSEPFFARYSRLSENTLQQTHSNVTLVWIWYDDRHIPTSHLGMPSTRIWAFKAQLAQAAYKFTP
jgi:hypothetical protein